MGRVIYEFNCNVRNLGRERALPIPKRDWDALRERVGHPLVGRRVKVTVEVEL